MSFDFGAMEQGIGELVRAKMGLAENAVLWSAQNVGEPAPAVRTWVSLKRGDLISPVIADGVYAYETPGSPDGAEVTLSAQGPRNFTLSIQAFARGDSNGRGGATGNSSAYAALSRLASALRLPSSEAALLALGVGLNRVSNVRNMDALVDQRIQGRALLECTLNLVESAEETVTYIQQVSGTFTPDAPPTPIPFESGP